MSVRKPSNRSRRNLIGYFYSSKMKRHLPFESTVQLDQCYLLDYAPNVVHFETEPLVINYEYDGKDYQYVPDIYAELVDEPARIYECKPAKYVNTDINQRKISAGRAYCKQNGLCFVLAISETIRAGFFLKNVKFLHTYAERSVSVERKHLILDVLSHTITPFTIESLAQSVDAKETISCMHDIFYMLFHSEITTNIEHERLQFNSFVWLP